MASDLTAASVYARAAFEASGDKAATVLDEVDALVALRSESPLAWEELTAPQVPAEALKATLDKLFAAAQPISRNFLRVLVDKRRLDLLPEIVAELRTLVQEQESQLDVNITTAIELDDALRGRLEQQLSGSTGKQVRLHASVDPNIIGGLVVQHGDTLVDTSLRSRLDQLRLQLSRPAARTASNSDQ